MLKERIIEKFIQVLASVPAEQQAALATELAKMMPANEQADVDWRVGSGYDEETKIIKISFSAKINPILIQKYVNLPIALTQLISCTPIEQIASIHKILTLIEDGLEKPYTLALGMMPVLPLSDMMSILTFSIHSLPNALLSKQIEEEQAVLN